MDEFIGGILGILYNVVDNYPYVEGLSEEIYLKIQELEELLDADME
jgi:hypothetical protein